MTETETLLKDLNPSQRQAVEKTEGPVLILAGAGSGKTRVITYRIAYLIRIGIDSERILAVTFTNKAAEEMAGRVRKLVAQHHRLWIGTFHSTCVRILRKNIERLGYRNDFIIYDDVDQIHTIKESLRELALNEKEFRPQAVLGRISGAKNELIGPEEFTQWIGNYFDQKVCDVYRLYQRKLKANNALDFDDIIMNTVALFVHHPDVLSTYRDHFQYIMIDEYQDTNHSQYRLVNLLAVAHQNLCVVGDPDQAIYRWRGADFRNLLRFEDDYPGCTQIVLDENYRSTQNILDAANSVIRFNRMRKEKNLWTRKSAGDQIRIFNASNEHEEVDFIVNMIERMKRTELRSYRDVVVFYRTHAQSRIFEDGFRRAGIPYQIVGGVGFYQRKEIKDVVAYLRLIEGTGDVLSFHRTINIPARGIGEATLEKFHRWRGERGLGLFEALSRSGEIQTISQKSRLVLACFAQLIRDLRAMKDSAGVPDLVTALVERAGYFDELTRSDEATAQMRIENVKEFVSFAEEYVLETPQATLLDFLERISLVSDVDQWNESDEKLTLMTLHAAKGLEFPVVFITGLEEGLCPHASASMDEMELEEERRLFYVGMTRAKERLFLTNAASRLIYGRRASSIGSRFLGELPDGMVRFAGLYDHDVEDSGLVHPPEVRPPVHTYSVSQKVLHPVFGIGEILEIGGDGDEIKVRVGFEKSSSPKWLMAKYARLTPLS